MAAPAPTMRKDLSAPGLIRTIRSAFESVPDHRRTASVRFSLPDTLLAAQAMFAFKCPSLLEFDNSVRDPEDSTVRTNLRRLFAIEAVACDSQMREILDPVNPAELRGAFRAVHRSIQRGGLLGEFTALGGRTLVSIDGTGQFGSSTVRCEHCCTVASNKKGIETEYRHQLLAAAIVSPDRPGVALPIDFEPIVRADGAEKNDCELCAAKRLIDALGAAYPHRSMVVLEDALYANGPHVKRLQERGLDFIIGVKPTGSEALFAELDRRRAEQPERVVEHDEVIDPATGAARGYRFTLGVSINVTHPETKLNVLEFWEVDNKGVEHNWSWATSLEITPKNAFEIARAGRSRWRIENEVFNTLKCQGYEFEHNYGHGKVYLASVLAGLMLLAFLVDQVQEQACRWFAQARTKARIRKTLWAKMRTYLEDVELEDWEMLWRLIAKKQRLVRAEATVGSG